MIDAVHDQPTYIEKIIEANSRNEDPSQIHKGGPPNFGRFVVEHMGSYQGQIGSAANTYRDYDEAVKDSLDNARYMRNDCGVMECIEARQRACALLDWTLIPENENSQEQKDLCEELTKILRRIPRFTEYRFNLLHAIWYGKYGIQHRYAWQNVGGRQRVMPARLRENVGWLPINGDKLVFRFRSNSAQPHQLPYQVGIRVGANYQAGDQINEHWKVEATDRGMAYFPNEYERKILAIHKHTIEDGAYEDALSAGMIHGVGVRSRIYWEWVQKQEAIGMMVEYLERSAGGIRLWKYPEGNPEAKRNAERSAKNASGGGYNDLLVPVPMGEDGFAYGVEVIEPGMGGIDALRQLVNDYFGHRIKRYILGQVLTTEAQATGLGSGVAEAHMDSFLQIIKYDASNLEETITEDLLRNIQHWNFPQSKHIDIRFQLVTEDSNTHEKLEAYNSAWTMGARIREQDVMEIIGAAIPTENDRVLENPQIKQAEMMGQMMGGQQPGGGMFGGPGPQQPQMPPPEQELEENLREQFGLEQQPQQPIDGQTEQYSRPKELRSIRNNDLTANISTLRKIAEDAIAGTAIDRDMITDIQVVGSATNLSRFTDQSDIDVHLIVDPPEGIRAMVMDYMRDVAALWNLKHHITIGGHPVELFAEDVSEPSVSDGKFSLITGEWIREPVEKVTECEAAKVTRQADKIERAISLAIKDQDLEELQNFLDRLRESRKRGLARDGEDSLENCVYKELRNRGALVNLKDAGVRAYDEAHSRYQREWKEEQHPRDENGRFTHTSQVGQKVSTPGLRGSGPVNYEIAGDDGDVNGSVRVRNEHGMTASVPRESLHQFHSDTTGDYSYLQEWGQSKSPQVNKVINGEAKFIDKGADGVVHDTGDGFVVKSSTTVPYHPVGAGEHATPREAFDIFQNKLHTERAMHAAGVKGILETKNGAHGDKLFSVRKKLDIPEKLTPDQLGQVEESIKSAHANGFVFGDEIQVGVDENGEVFHYDVGSARVSTNDLDRKDDWSAFNRLKAKSGFVDESGHDDKLERLTNLVETLDNNVGDHPEWRVKRFFNQAKNLAKEIGDPLVESYIDDLWSDYRNTTAASYSKPGEPERYRYVQRDPDLRKAIEAAANETEADPSDSQKKSGNFRKGKFHLHGLEIAIETPKGATRSGKSRLGVEWEVTMPAHYGYIRRTAGKDGDHLDVFIGPNPESEIVYVVDQKTQGGKFDEHKAILGCQSKAEAKQLYQASYSKGWGGLKAITPMTIDQFRSWLADGNQNKPIQQQVSKYSMDSV